MAHIKNILKEERDPHLPEKEVSEIDETDKKGELALLVVNRNELVTANFPPQNGNEYHLHCLLSGLKFFNRSVITVLYVEYVERTIAIYDCHLSWTISRIIELDCVFQSCQRWSVI
jgi:hypothetical protein